MLCWPPERYDDLLDLLEMAPYTMWTYRQYGVKALAAQGKKSEALRYAEDGRGRNDSAVAIALCCEEKTRERIHEVVAREHSGERFVTKVLGHQLDMT